MSTPYFEIRGQQIIVQKAASRHSERLDKVLVAYFPAYSRTFLQRAIEQGRVSINGTSCYKPSTMLTDAATISVSLQELTQDASVVKDEIVQAIPITVVYESDYFVVLNKPPFLSVHKPLPSSPEVTLVDWLRSFLPRALAVGEPHRPGIIHRLDKDTSGLIIIATDPRAHTIFSKLFKQRAIKKTYRAIVSGLPPAEGVITYPIARHPLYRVKMTHSRAGKEACTRYRVHSYFEKTALVEFFPETGRTHQIRVHAAAIGHPIVGDVLYGNRSPDIKRHALHALELDFVYEGTTYHFTSSLPEDMRYLISLYQ